MKPSLVDVPVLMLFFNRPQQLSQVFEQVRTARPSIRTGRVANMTCLA